MDLGFWEPDTVLAGLASCLAVGYAYNAAAQGIEIEELSFEIEGEAGFRRREKKLIEELTQLQNIVLATGGGAVLDGDNRRCLKQRGFVVYLRAPVTRLFARTHRDHSRPLLQTNNPYSKLEEIVEQRDPLYRQVADLITDTDHRTIRQVVEEITKIWKSP
jgi:shikimate kinase